MSRDSCLKSISGRSKLSELRTMSSIATFGGDVERILETSSECPSKTDTS